MEKLPQDIKFNIFSRLSAESLLEYKQVCKSWLGLLEDPSFAQIHLRRQLLLLQQYLNKDDTPNGSSTSTPVPYGCGGGFEFGFILLAKLVDSDDVGDRELLYGKYDENDEQSYEIVKRINHPIIKTIFDLWVLVGSCNGLICLSTPSENVYGDPTHIFNPITREYLNLPRLSGGESSSKRCGKIMNGFGYNSFTNEYKVVRIFYPDNQENLGHLQVYTLGAGSGWRDKGEVTYPFLSMYGSTCTATHVNGKLHWLDEERNIVAFDLADEEFNFIQSPPIVYFDGPREGQLRVLGGWLGLAHHVFTACSSHADIWLLKKKSTTVYDMKEQDHRCWGWSKEFSISTDGSLEDDISLLALTKKGEVLFWDSDYSFCRYDPKSAIIEKLQYSDGKCVEAIPHINSFVSLKALGEILTEE